jgi:indolepyruvate ferredoxin oxidoreductase alpha subunit
MKKLLSGNEALAHGAYEAGVGVAASYPGTPSSEILETLALFEGVNAEWSPNEKVAFEVAYGASIAGARAIVSMKHVGLNVAADPLMTSSYAGVNAGFVIVTCDDPGLFSSQNEQDNRNYAKFAKIPFVEPSDAQEAHDFVKEAFRISEIFDTPVIIRMTTRVSHTKCPVTLGKREEIALKPYKKNIEKYIMIPAHAAKRHPNVEERLERLREYSEETFLNRIEIRDRRVGIITGGISYHYAREVFRDASILKLGFWPFPQKLIRSFVEEVDEILVIEELDPFIEETLLLMGIRVRSKPKKFRVGELTPRRVRKAFNLPIKPSPNPVPLFRRPPALCPGCPHIGVFYVLKRMRLTVTGDIGCYTLGALPPLSAMDTTIEMGASVGMAHGFEKARGREFAGRTVGVIGDSTFLHSGITGLMDIVYNKGTSTILILDNRTTAMTGHQDHPGTGKTAKGEKTRAIDLKELVRGLGVGHVKRIDPHNLRETRRSIQEALDREEPSVIIFERPCVLLPDERLRVRERKKMEVKEDICRGETCKNCLELGCPAIQWKGASSHIEPILCIGCKLCIQVCPYGAIS